MRTDKPLTYKLTATIWLISATSALIMGFVAIYILLGELRSHIEGQLESSTDQLIETGLEELHPDGELDELHDLIRQTLALSRLDLIIRVFDAEGNLLFSSFPEDEIGFLTTGVYLDPLEETQETDLEQFQTYEGKGRDFLSYGQAYTLDDGQHRFIQVSTPIPRTQDILQQAMFQYISFLILLLIASFFIAHFFARKLLSPVRSIADQLGELKNTDIKQWKNIDVAEDPQMLGEIVRAVNNLITRVQRSFLSLYSMSRYIAHEIRTPLTIMLGEVETTLKGNPKKETMEEVLKTITKDITKMDSTIKTILEISLRERETSPHHPKPTPLFPQLQELQDYFKKVFQVEFKIEQESDKEIIVHIDPELFSLLMDNLMRNAIKHSPTNSQKIIRVSVPNPNQVQVTVIDQGPGLPEDLVEAANSLNSTHPKLGIGLSICHEICYLTGWKIQFQNSSQGLEVRVQVPAA